MITQKQLKKFFTFSEAAYINAAYVGSSAYGDVHTLNDGYEAWINDKYRYDTLHITEDGGTVSIFNDDGERWIQLSDRVEFRFYKVFKKEVK